ncbi:UNVERIFIED_CONTAM: hypothetical protein GTU68_055928 [Idotea baltica]|nr:hypothetical protein [Idotea baltica]
MCFKCQQQRTGENKETLGKECHCCYRRHSIPTVV